MREMLKNQVSVLLDQIEEQISQLEQLAARGRHSASQLRDGEGGYLLTPLLQAKAEALSTLARLEEDEG